MVRRITGEIIYVGKLAAKGEDVMSLEPNFSYNDENAENGVVPRYLKAKAKAEAPEGLTLMQVFY